MHQYQTQTKCEYHLLTLATQIPIKKVKRSKVKVVTKVSCNNKSPHFYALGLELLELLLLTIKSEKA